MAIDLYQPFTNPITRETFRCISFTEEAYTMEWTVAPRGYVPFEHVHVNQDEIFHIQSGEMKTRMNDVMLTSKANETVTVPKGTRHIGFNQTDEPLICIVEYKPGLDQYTTMQYFAGLTLDGYYHKNGLVNIPRVMYMLRKANAKSLTRPAFAPDWLFRLGMQGFYLLGIIFGWEKLYRKYTS